MVDEKKSNYILIFFPAHTLSNLKKANEAIKNFMLWGGVVRSIKWNRKHHFVKCDTVGQFFAVEMTG